MAFVNTVDILGDEVITDKFIEGTIEELRDEYITVAGIAAFGQCQNLTLVDLPNVTNIAGSSFIWTVKLKALILRNKVVCTLANGNAFVGSGVEIGDGYIYIPAALKTQYQQATNWSTYAAQFRALEDYTVDGTIWGDLDENKI